MTEARRTHRLPSTWVQMAIIPTNSDSDASAAASWITVLNMAFSPERRENIVHVLFSSQVIKTLVDHVVFVPRVHVFPCENGPVYFVWAARPTRTFGGITGSTSRA